MPKFLKSAGGAVNDVASYVKRSVNKINKKNSPPDSDNAKIIVKLIFAVLSMVFVIVVIVSGTDISPAALARGAEDKKALLNASGEGYPMDIEGSRTVSVKAIPNGTAVLTDTNYTVLNNDGQEISSSAHYMASPVMKTASRYSLIYDENSMGYSVRTISGSLLSGKADHPIVSGAISKSGKFVLVTQHDTSFSYVSVYSKNGRVLHKWKSGNYCITDAAISPSGNYIAMSGVNTDGGVIKSCVIIQKVGGNENLRECIFDGTLMFSVEFTSSDTVTAVGDTLCAQLHVGSEKRSVFDYNGESINSFDFNDDGELVLVLSQYSDGKNCHAVALSSSGEKLVDIATQLTSPSVELTSNRVNLVSRGSFYSYNMNGSLADSAEIPADGQNSVTSGGKTLIRGVTSITEVK